MTGGGTSWLAFRAGLRDGARSVWRSAPITVGIGFVAGSLLYLGYLGTLG